MRIAHTTNGPLWRPCSRFAFRRSKRSSKRIDSTCHLPSSSMAGYELWVPNCLLCPRIFLSFGQPLASPGTLLRAELNVTINLYVEGKEHA